MRDVARRVFWSLVVRRQEAARGAKPPYANRDRIDFVLQEESSCPRGYDERKRDGGS